MPNHVLDLPICKIRPGNRHRKDMGDLKELAQSIKEEGLASAHRPHRGHGPCFRRATAAGREGHPQVENNSSQDRQRDQHRGR